MFLLITLDLCRLQNAARAGTQQAWLVRNIINYHRNIANVCTVTEDVKRSCGTNTTMQGQSRHLFLGFSAYHCPDFKILTVSHCVLCGRQALSMGVVRGTAISRALLVPCSMH